MPLKNAYLMSQIIFGNRWRHLLGERDFWEHVGGIDVSLAPSSFGQANTRVKILTQWIFTLYMHLINLQKLFLSMHGHQAMKIHTHTAYISCSNILICLHKHTVIYNILSVRYIFRRCLTSFHL
jgi:hypothetical protein